MNVVTSHTIDREPTVFLWQDSDGDFVVEYGDHHVRGGLDYATAAAEFGECVMHAAACAGRLV